MTDPSLPEERKPHPDPEVEALLHFGLWEEKARAEAEAWAKREAARRGSEADGKAGEP